MQCYDKYLLKDLKETAEAQGHAHWGKPPSNVGSYNSRPQDTGFFKDGGDWDSYYGRFFIKWYSQILIDHGDCVLSIANKVFEGSKIAAKVRILSIPDVVQCSVIPTSSYVLEILKFAFVLSS